MGAGGRTQEQAAFIEFLEYLLVEQVPNQKIVLVLDIASYHSSRASRAALSLFEPRVRVFWLPMYSPILNLIERFWRHLKDIACANRLDLSLDNLLQRVLVLMMYQNSVDHPLKLPLIGVQICSL